LSRPPKSIILQKPGNIRLDPEKSSYSREVTKFAKKADGYTKNVNHLVGEAPLFNNCLISWRLRVFV
jgi:hypothetical protein